MMLPEPERVLVVRYLAKGGMVIHIPFGVSGAAWLTRFTAAARGAGKLGWIRRYGIGQVPADAVGAILDGRIPITAARVTKVWRAARAPDGAPLSWIAHRVGVHRSSVERTLQLLLESGDVERANVSGSPRYRAVGAAAPHWSEFAIGDDFAAGNDAGGQQGALR